MKNRRILREFSDLDVGSINGSRDLAESLLPVSNALYDLVGYIITEQGVELNAENMQSVRVIEGSIGFSERQSFLATRFALDYGTTLSITRTSPRLANSREAHAVVPLRFRLEKFIQDGYMSFGGFYAQIDERQYSPFAPEATVADARIYARCAQMLMRPIIDKNTVGSPLVWPSPLPTVSCERL